MKIKAKDLKVRDYVTLGEINHGTGCGAHISKKDKKNNRKSKENQRLKNELKKYY